MRTRIEEIRKKFGSSFVHHERQQHFHRNHTSRATNIILSAYFFTALVGLKLKLTDLKWLEKQTRKKSLVALRDLAQSLVASQDSLPEDQEIRNIGNHTNVTSNYSLEAGNPESHHLQGQILVQIKT